VCRRISMRAAPRPWPCPASLAAPASCRDRHAAGAFSASAPSCERLRRPTILWAGGRQGWARTRAPEWSPCRAASAVGPGAVRVP
jgi:hypothetical protein